MWCNTIISVEDVENCGGYDKNCCKTASVLDAISTLGGGGVFGVPSVLWMDIIQYCGGFLLLWRNQY